MFFKERIEIQKSKDLGNLITTSCARQQTFRKRTMNQEPRLRTEHVTTKEDRTYTHIWRRLFTVAATEFVCCRS